MMFLATAAARVPIYSDANNGECYHFPLISVWANVLLFWYLFLYGGSEWGLEEIAGGVPWYLCKPRQFDNQQN